MMKIFTLIATVLIMSSGNVMAQKRFVHKNLRTSETNNVKKVQGLDKASKRPAKIRKAAAAQLYMPLHEDVFYYEDEWIKTGYTDYKYDTSGNVLTSDYVTEDGTIRTEYEYDENNQWTSQTEYNSDGSSDLQPSGRRTRIYDDIVKDLVVESMQYTWTAGDWMLIDQGYTWKRNVTRDSKGNVTGVSVDTYYIDGFETTRKTTITYNQDGLADTWKYEELAYDGVSLAWEEYYTLEDMQWYSTDGQIVTDDIEGFFTGNNRLKSAKVIEPAYGETGRIEAEYDEDGNYSYTFLYNDPVESDVYTFKYIDENGSTEEEYIYYSDMNEDGQLSDDELMESSKIITRYNEKGDITAEEYYFGDEFDSGTKYDIEYGDYSYPTEWVMSEYDYDLEDYVPYMKLVRSNFVDVTNTSSINSVAGSSETGVQNVYNLHGMKVGTQTSNLPAGLYLIKKDGKTVKVLKK